MQDNLVKHRQKTSPYTKNQRLERRNEVFKLYFEYGYSASKISDMMKINRNTINSDVTFLYSQLFKEDNKLAIEDWLNKQKTRFEMQRTRLRKQLDKNTTIQEKLQIERLLFDVDSQITKLVMNIFNSRETVWNTLARSLNNEEKKKGSQFRYIKFGDMRQVSAEDNKKIRKIIERSN